MIIEIELTKEQIKLAEEKSNEMGKFLNHVFNILLLTRSDGNPKDCTKTPSL